MFSCCCCWLLPVSRQCDTRPRRCRFALARPPPSGSPCPVHRSFAKSVGFHFSAFPGRTLPTDDHVAEHGSCARRRLPDTRRRMVSHRNHDDYVCPVTSAVPPTCRGLLLLLLSDSTADCRCTRCRIRCSCDQLHFGPRSAPPSFFFSFSYSGLIRCRYVSPRGGLILERNWFANAEWHSKFRTSARRRLGVTAPACWRCGTQLEHTRTFGLDYIQDAQAVVIMPIFMTGPPTMSNIL